MDSFVVRAAKPYLATIGATVHVDTNCDPDLANMSIPANDDTMTSIRLILNKLVFTISEGRSLYIRNR
ncbi:hypothetical protein BDA96_01G338200 [Sorghum bicolor]|uniref:Small ribosomal subunit protein uS2c n=1 Tax=Sorghum bicolor TaxID=4558 RepID=A0A921UZN8_SORBI|nr:hypothetical protein BDA96_01G338200 [Sorghum bicolor]